MGVDGVDGTIGEAARGLLIGTKEVVAAPVVEIVSVMAARARPADSPAGLLKEQYALTREPGRAQVNEAVIGIAVFAGMVAISSRIGANVPAAIWTTPECASPDCSPRSSAEKQLPLQRPRQSPEGYSCQRRYLR